MPLGAILALFRVGNGGYRGVVWAEDGVVFLGSAYDQGGWHSLLSPYNGYVLLVPRSIAALVAELPIAWHGVAVNMAAVAVQAAVAGFAFHVVRANTRGLLAPLLVAVAVVLFPVAGETVGNLANLQWFFLLAGGIAPFWRPAGWPGRLSSIAFVLAVTTSCPFGGVALVACAGVWLLCRDRFSALLTAVAFVGTAVEAVGMLRAPSRTTPIEHAVAPFDLVRGYTVRVAGDGVFGLHYDTLSKFSESLWPGLAVLGGAGVLAVLAVRRRGWLAIVVPGVLLVESMVTFAAPVVLAGVHWRVAAEAPRYYVAPGLLFVTAVAVLAGQEMRDRVPGGRRTLDRMVDGDRPARAQLVVLGLLVCGLCVGWATSYTLPASGRDGGPAWGTQVRQATSICSQGKAKESAQGPVAPVRITPPGWVVPVPCSRLNG